MTVNRPKRWPGSSEPPWIGCRMTTEAIAIPAARERSLAWKASLNLVQAVLDYGTKLAVGFIIIPIMVSGLGRSLFGVWEMMDRLVGYLESTDGRSTHALRLVISHQQADDDPAA